MQLSPGKLIGMKRLSNEKGHFKMTAIDQRPPIKGPIAAYYNVDEAPWEEVAKFKRLLVETLQDNSTALLLDPHYAIPHAINILKSTKGLIVTLEDSIFEEHKGGRLSKNIDNWSVSKIKRMGGDAVKVLAWYRPDADKHIINAQKDYIKKIGEECARHDILFLLELLVYPLAQDNNQTKEYIEMKDKKSEYVLKSVEDFSNPEYRVDVFKLESPINADQLKDNDSWVFEELGKLAGRPWVMLSAGAGKEDFKKVLKLAFKAGASGFLAGRAIWLDAFNNYPQWEKIKSDLNNFSNPYLSEIGFLAQNNAQPWNEHLCYGSNGAKFKFPDEDFRHNYNDMSSK